MTDNYSMAENSPKDILSTKRKRPRGPKQVDKDEELSSTSKRSSPMQDSGSESSGHDLVISMSDHEQQQQQEIEEAEKSPSPDSIDDLPMEALIASTLTQFSSCIRPSLMVAYPAATGSEITAITNAKWKSLKEARRKQAGNLAKRTKVAQAQGETEEVSRPKRRAAAKRSYLEDNMESPISEEDEEMSMVHVTSMKEKGTKKKHKKGKGAIKKSSTTEVENRKFPKIKLKMIRRRSEDNEPIILAQSTIEEEEKSEFDSKTYLKSKLKVGQESDTSSLQLEDDDSVTINLSRSPSVDEEDDTGTSTDEDKVEDNDSEGEHADYCYTCKDGGELLCCDKCPLTYHLECTFPPLKKIPDGEWLCQKCTAEALPVPVERILTWRWIKLTNGDTGNKEVDNNGIADQPTENPSLISSTIKRPTPKMREYFVKWLGKSYWKCSWVSEIRLEVHQTALLRSYTHRHKMDIEPILELPVHQERRRRRRSSFYDEKMEEKELMLLKAGVRPEWLQIHRIINSMPHKKGTKFLVKWKDLPYDKATWEYLDDPSALRGSTEAVKQYEKLRSVMDAGGKKKKGRPKIHRADPKKKYTEQPSYITATGGTLHPYQLEGINWLRFSWGQGTNTILGDEMGLGKTIQTIVFLYSLVKEGLSNGPFLISAPLSTMINWEREFEFWAPDLYVVTYTGHRESRAAIRENEFSFIDGAVKGNASRLYKLKKDTPLKFHVLLTSYEFVTVDSTVLQSINWSVLVVDEAHRMKNNQSKFFKCLSQYNLKYKLLLTGTPLQNNLEELFHLLNFLCPENFNALEAFQEEFADISKEDQIEKLHQLLGPHLLRRLKADVLKNMPSKSELIVRVDLAPAQKKYYRWILTKNFDKLNVRGSHSVSLLNIMMELKKCCNHPYLFPIAAEEAPLVTGGYYEGKALIASCGKLIVLEKMLKKLREQGHRVLIFSQMTKLLDILEDFLEHLNYKYERIDGSVSGLERQLSIDRFNAPGAEQFVFLLSTRAGGLGINLATADTVIIYDSDWNPHNDIQALSRAHRIGQANKVMIYRFVTRKSVEERVCEVAKRKMMLTHLVVRSGFGASTNQPSLSRRELDDILKFGTEDLFKDEESTDSQDSMGIVYDDKAIEMLLDRSIADTEEKGPSDENLLANEYLGQFKVASYVMKEKAEPETEILKDKVEQTEQPGDPNFWERLLRHHYEQQKELEAAKLGKGKRIRKQVNYHDGMSADLSELKASTAGEHEDGDESMYEESDNDVSEEESDDEVEYLEPGSRRNKGKRVNKTLSPLLAKVNDCIHVYGFNPRQRRIFLNQVLRFGMPPPDVYNLPWMPKELRNKSENDVNAYISAFMRHLCEPDNPNSEVYSDGVPKNSVSRHSLLTRIGVLKLIQNKINQYKDVNGEYSLEEDLPDLQPSTTAVVTMDKDLGVVPMETDSLLPPAVDTNLPEQAPLVQTEGESHEHVIGNQEEGSAATTVTGMVDEMPKTIIEDVQVKDESDDHEADSDPVIVSVTKSMKQKPKLKFNIADGGFTELHTLWAHEKTESFNPAKWGRHHDYWLLRGITLHGFCRWTEICTDPKLSIINKPFKPQESTEVKNRFLLRRYKLLEQALAVEEQLHRASNAGLHQNPNDSVMQLHSRFTDLDCLADGHQMLVKDCVNGNKNAIVLMRKALGKMEELLLDMKSDVSKLSMELIKLPLVSKQLKIDEISTLGKLANKDNSSKKPIFLPAQPSVITQSKTNTTSTVVTRNDVTSTIPVAKPDSENVVLLSNTPSTATSALQYIQQKPAASTTQYTTTPVTAAAINMTPTAFVSDGTTLLVPAAHGSGTLPIGQQVLYWAPGQVSGSNVTTATVSAQQAPPTAIHLLKPDSSSNATKKSYTH